MKLINAEAFEADMERWVPDDVRMINGEWHNLYLDDHIKGHIDEEPEVDVALDKQMPKKPRLKCPSNKLLDGWYECECGHTVGVDDIRDNYCTKCGQAIDWSEEK